ncbi:unnamed protein product [Rhizophagus irregularis]|uniref:RRM domain-containing protein n=1 Tax=Rhizophagus irregularis TaxID=588596 RepID=A0A915ZEI5_9GLOM|nr:unnamed protein product [Rhizophagus irregularis]
MLLKIINQIKLYGKPIRVNKNLDVDASLFIRNLDPDAAIDAMNGQYLMNKPITVSYAFKKDGKGERHGSAAERLLAAQAKKIKNLCLQMSIFIRYVVYQENRFGWELRFDVDQRLGIEIDRFALPESNW